MCYVMQSCLSGLEVLLTLFQPEGADYAYYATASTSGFEKLTTSLLCYAASFFEQNLILSISKILWSLMLCYDLLCCWLLRVESCDFSQAEKERTACKAVKIHKMTTIFTQNGPRLYFWLKIIVILWICTTFLAVLSFSAWEKSRNSTL